MKPCACRPKGPMCLAHYGLLSKQDKRKHKRKIGIR